MKKIFTALTIALTVVCFFNACKKVESLPSYANGTSITLTASKTAVVATPADSTTQVVSFSWTNPKYASDSNTYKFILEIDSTGRNFSKSTSKIVIGKFLTGLTGRELNSIVLNYGFALGTSYGMDIRVTSSYGNNNERYLSNVVKVNVTPYNDPSTFATSQTAVTCTLANAANASNTFSWTPSFTGYSGVVTYSIQYDSANKNFAAPLEIAVGPSILTKGLTQGEMNSTALSKNVPGGNTGKIEYRLKAVTAQGATSFSNAVSVTIQSYQPLIRLYMPGSYQGSQGLGTDWTPSNAPEFIRDTRPAALNKLYYTYTYLPAGTAFKITPQRDFSLAYGNAGGGNLSTTGGDITVPTAGFYRISIDLSTMKYDIRLGRMGFVGGAVPGNSWTPATTFTDVNSQMGLVSRDRFVGINNFAVDGWKLIDDNNWNDGSINTTNARSYGSLSNGSGNGSSLEINNGNNMPNPSAAARWRVIFDGIDPNNPVYIMNPATEMRVVGDGINQAGVNDWDPPSSPQMTYMGNGKWQITLVLKASKSIKFVAGNAWGAFDYEDNGAGTGTGVRKIKWDGGGDFATPSTAGTRTITLDEKAGTVTIL